MESNSVYCSDMFLQYLAIAVIIGICIVWMFRRLRHRGHSSDTGCDGCALSRSCNKKAYLEEKTCKKSVEDLDNPKD